MIVTLDGIEYVEDEFGVIHQLNPNPFDYSQEYVNIYSDPAYAEKSKDLNRMRLENVFACYSRKFGTNPRTLLDVGYGDGSFLEQAIPKVPKCYGMDISPQKPPKGVTKVNDYSKSYDVITYFDSFEHIPDISFIKNVKANMIVMSMPNLQGKIFNTWKHRKPDEHLHHFTPDSISKFMAAMGWTFSHSSTLEDVIRKGEKRNIMTAVFFR